MHRYSWTKLLVFLLLPGSQQPISMPAAVETGGMLAPSGPSCERSGRKARWRAGRPLQEPTTSACVCYISKTKVLTHRTLLKNQASYGVTEYTKRQITWPGQRSILHAAFKIILLNYCSGVIPRATPLAYGGEGLDWNEAGSGSNC